MTVEQRGDERPTAERAEHEGETSSADATDSNDGSAGAGDRASAGTSEEGLPDASEETPPDASEEATDDYLGDVPDGSGCTEIWEHLSEVRDDDD